MVGFALTFIVLLSTKLIQATPSGNRDDLQDQEIAEIKKMMTLQSRLIQSQAEMLQEYGERIALLEKENTDLVKQTEQLRTANEVMELRLTNLDREVDMDTRPEEGVHVTSGQSTEKIEAPDQLHKPVNQGEAVQEDDGNLPRIRRVANVPGLDGERIASLEKENTDLVKQTEKLRTANEVMESRLTHLDREDMDTRPEEDVHVTSRQSTEKIKDPDQLHKPINQGEAVQEDDGNLPRIRRVANVPKHNLTAVGFYCRLMSPDPLLLGQHQTIEFDDVVTNIGNGYDSRHGHFTAPVAGLYSFTSTVLLVSSSNHLMHLSIMKNGVDIGYLFSNSAYDKGTRTVVLSLAEGDMVWVRNNENNSPSINGAGYSTFSGFLITTFSQGN